MAPELADGGAEAMETEAALAKRKQQYDVRVRRGL